MGKTSIMNHHHHHHRRRHRGHRHRLLVMLLTKTRMRTRKRKKRQKRKNFGGWVPAIPAEVHRVSAEGLVLHPEPAPKQPNPMT